MQMTMFLSQCQILVFFFKEYDQTTQLLCISLHGQEAAVRACDISVILQQNKYILTSFCDHRRFLCLGFSCHEGPSNPQSLLIVLTHPDQSQ